MSLSPEDDFFHAPTTDERWWSETYWFSFDDPVHDISGTFYPLLRKNLDIASLTVAIWSPGQSTTWSAPYHRSHWHLRPPDFAGNYMEIEGLSYEVLEPLQAYRVKYADADVFSTDLSVRGIAENFVPIATPDRGHWDQATRLTGWLELHGKRIDIDCFGMRDRSWGPRLDDVSARATYLYGINADSSFLLVTQMTGEAPFTMGYLDRDGQRGAILAADVSAQRDEDHRVTSVRISAKDEHGRELATQGTPRNHMAKQASPGYFAWMSMIDWDIDEPTYGQFQDVYSPDRLSAANSEKLLF
jgi:hypothetical protein